MHKLNGLQLKIYKNRTLLNRTILKRDSIFIPFKKNLILFSSYYYFMDVEVTLSCHDTFGMSVTLL